MKDKIITRYNPKPIPIRRYDWEATLKNFDAEVDFIGYGATEQEAIDDLIIQEVYDNK